MIKLLKFVDTLPPKDQLFFLLMRSCLDTANLCGDKELIEANMRLYQNALKRLISHDDQKEITSVEQKRVDPLALIDKQLDDKLGEWASSFTVDSDPDRDVSDHE